jgi:hypothetical protein
MSGVTNILQYALLSNLNNLIGSGGLSLHSNFLIAALWHHILIDPPTTLWTRRRVQRSGLDAAAGCKLELKLAKVRSTRLMLAVGGTAGQLRWLEGSRVSRPLHLPCKQ